MLHFTKLTIATICLSVGITGICAAQESTTAGNAEETSARHWELTISNEALQAMYLSESTMFGIQDSQWRAGVFLNEDRDLVGMGSMLLDVGDRRRNDKWRFALGPQLYAALLTEEDQDIFSVALGGSVRSVPTGRAKLSLMVSAFYAPDILTFGTADNVTDLTARLELKLRDKAVGFVGVRRLEFDLLEDDRELDESVHIGVRRAF